MSWGIGDRVGVAVSAGTIATFKSRRPGPVPSLVLDFAGTGTLDPRVTFTRSTTGTYYNSSGVLSTAAIDAPRFDYNPSTLAPLGLLIEQSSTNIALYSEQFNNAVWVKTNATVVANSTTAPDGTSTADLIYPTFSVTFAGAYQTVLAGNTISIYSKFSGISYLYIVDKPGAAGAAWFNLSTGTVGTVIAGYTSSIQSVGNGWYRCTLTANTGTFNYFQIGLSNTDNSTSVTTSGTNGIYIWGAQDEALAFPTSYIPTTSAQVTRASDNASMTGTNFSSWFNIAQGSLYTEWFLPSLIPTSRTSTQITDSSVTNRFIVQADNSALVTRHLGFINGSAQIVMDIGSLTAGSSKDMYAYQAGSSAASRNGSTVATSSYANIPSGMNRMDIGNDVGGSFLNGYIKKIAYYPIRVTNAQLQALTGN